ncbi:putative carboxylesterase 18 [Cucumis melo var. makuwa]|uniref:Carboxylesterase 18 n=2 Tax=Cucumis melo TaxID=3656 RepID=A0A5D3BL91_CUCMM|nr:probable carboxylesterase 18 [Cucumis melo]KAA0039340.1 putative carboxylesterase 18 [Cucumis melo var. makuwa]TYK00523.1 putative carboxylesterase 18 [Cucumis melo var. makuwa]
MCSSGVCYQISTPQLPWKHRITLRFATLLYNTSLRSDLTVNRRLLNFIDPKIPSNHDSTHSVSSSDLIVDTSRDLFLRIFTPTPTAALDESLPLLPIIFYFHGGGFVFGSADATSTDMAARRFAKKLCAVVISVNYRLAPEFRFPCQCDDGFDPLKFIDEMDDDSLLERVDLSRCFILGESAGGNLGHHVAVRASEYEFKRVKIIGFIASQPFFGGKERTESENRLCKQLPLTLDMTDWFWRAFLPAGEDRDHATANVNGPNGRDISGLENFPATLIFAGGLDLLIDRQKCYYERLKRMGKDVKLVVFSNAVHGYFGFADLPEYSLMIKEMRDFIAKN